MGVYILRNKTYVASIAHTAVVKTTHTHRESLKTLHSDKKYSSREGKKSRKNAIMLRSRTTHFLIIDYRA